MKSLLLIISMLFFVTACEETDDLASTEPIKGFSSVESLLFAYSERSENKYLVIDDVDNIGKRFEVLTYREDSSGNRSNQSVTVFYCDSNDCRTDQAGQTYQKIELRNNATEVVVGIWRESNDNNDDTLSSSSKYELIED